MRREVDSSLNFSGFYRILVILIETFHVIAKLRIGVGMRRDSIMVTIIGDELQFSLHLLLSLGSCKNLFSKYSCKKKGNYKLLQNPDLHNLNLCCQT